MRNRAMAGAGAKRMGGPGLKPAAPRTAMAGKPVGGPSAAPKPAMPKPPMAPPVGAAPPMPGGSGGGLGPPGGGGGMGGSGGFAKGGPTKKFAKGGAVSGADTKARVERDTGKAPKSD